MNKIAIVGGGPSGIYFALYILKFFSDSNYTDFKLTIIDKSQILRTILPTGGGRCNITNATSDIDEFLLNYPRGSKFLRSIFLRHFSCDSMNFFSSIGIDTYIDDELKVFPKTNSSKTVKDKMLNTLRRFRNVELVNDNIKSSDELNNYDYKIICAGSKDTKSLIESFGHDCIEFKPSLCALDVKNHIYPQGVSVKSLDGDFIFTKSGISGPLAYKICSLNSRKGFPYEININLINYDDLISAISSNTKKSIGNIVSNFIPKSFARAIVENFDKKASEVSKKDLLKLCTLRLEITSCTKDFEIVNSGGVNLDEIDKNCKSKLFQNLWFCGEILNIDGFCGGFNLQNCWSTAYIAALDVAKRVMNS